MNVIKYIVNLNISLFNILFLKGDVIYISEPSNGTIPHRQVFDGDKKYLGTIDNSCFKTDIKHKLTEQTSNIKDSYTREEVSKAIHDCMILANSQEIGRLQLFIDKWIENNL